MEDFVIDALDSHLEKDIEFKHVITEFNLNRQEVPRL